MNLLLPKEHLHSIKTTAHDCLISLATEEGIYASAREEAYGCVFGRDSAITILKLLNVYQKTHDLTLLEICRRGLVTLVELQGQRENIESGEQPGKFIHEFRRDKYERLVARKKPWYVYPDGYLRNYDSIDATPLALIALYRYFHMTGDREFLQHVLPSVTKGLAWIMEYGDKDGDGLLEYEFLPHRKFGGLVVQSWTDSRESLMQPDGTFPRYPIAPVEVQGVGWLALRLWSDFYETSNPGLSQQLLTFATTMKVAFYNTFLIQDAGHYFAAQALDGAKNQIPTITANPLVCLWTTYTNGGKKEAIIPDEMIGDFVSRAFLPDLFDPDAGIRTMSMLSPTFNKTATSYHNGSFWPMLNGLIHEGLKMWGYEQQAALLLHASLKPISHFGFPIELYMKNEKGEYFEYVSQSGKRGCRYQAWSAAAALDWVTDVSL